jgi:hypothetical protein
MPNPHEHAFAFASDFLAMEYALKRSGFIRKNKKAAEADWNLFSTKLGPDFFRLVVEKEIAVTLIGNPPRLLLADMGWSPPATVPLSNVTQLIVNGVCRVRNSYVHGEKFTGGPDGQWERDGVLISEAHEVLKLAMIFIGKESLRSS